jgi:two-component system, NtrC family, sensor kinase
MSGLEVCRWFKQNHRLRDTPVIFLTGAGGTDDRVEAFRAGGVDYISKPFQEQDVLARIRTHIRLAELRGVLEKHNLELELRQQQIQERLLAISRAARDAIIMLDNDGRVSHWNEAAEAMFGYSRAEILGKNLHGLLAPRSYREVHEAAFPHFRETGQGKGVGRTTEIVGVKKSGEEFPAELSLAATRLENRWCAVGIVRDTTERKREEQARHELEIELGHSQKLEAVGRLASGIAHEINTPIQYVGDSVGFLKEAFEAQRTLLAQTRRAVAALAVAGAEPALVEEILAAEAELDMGYLEANVPGSFERCQEGISRVATIVRAMKEFAHPGGKEMSPADLNQALEATLVIARNEYKYVAEVETALGEIPPVICHVGDLNQVFLNLIVNSAHAIADVVGNSGAKGKIRVSTARAGDQVSIEIADTGAGIPEVIRHRVFEPFFTTKPVGKGSGQGLAIARSIVAERHGGTLSYESTVGKGTTFTIRLPIDGQAGAQGAQAP